MKIRLHYPAPMHIDTIKNDSTTVGGFLQDLQLKKEHIRYILVYVNGERKGMSYVLSENDELKLYLPVGGG